VPIYIESIGFSMTVIVEDSNYRLHGKSLAAVHQRACHHQRMSSHRGLHGVRHNSNKKNTPSKVVQNKIGWNLKQR